MENNKIKCELCDFSGYKLSSHYKFIHNIDNPALRYKVTSVETIEKQRKTLLKILAETDLKQRLSKSMQKFYDSKLNEKGRRKSYSYICNICKKPFEKKFVNYNDIHNHKKTKNIFCSRRCVNKWKSQYYKDNNIKPPSRLGTKISEKHRQIISKTLKEQWKNNIAFRHKHYIRLTTPETHPLKQMIKKRKEQGLIRGYISWPQEQMFYDIKKFFDNSDVQLEFPIKYGNKIFFLDVAIPSIKIDFEYDGAYWHKNNVKDIQRDKLLNKLGWVVHRFNKNNILKLNETLILIKNMEETKWNQ